MRKTLAVAALVLPAAVVAEPLRASLGARVGVGTVGEPAGWLSIEGGLARREPGWIGGITVELGGHRTDAFLTDDVHRTFTVLALARGTRPLGRDVAVHAVAGAGLGSRRMTLEFGPDTTDRGLALAAGVGVSWWLFTLDARYLYAGGEACVTDNQRTWCQQDPGLQITVGVHWDQR